MDRQEELNRLVEEVTASLGRRLRKNCEQFPLGWGKLHIQALASILLDRKMQDSETQKTINEMHKSRFYFRLPL